jgi:hypothetical protein
MSVAPWSFSRIKAFEQCPKQFYHEKVLKQYPVVETDAMMYGTDFHKACEDFIAEGTPIPEKYSFIKNTMNKFNVMKGDKLCEYKMGLTADLEPCTFFAGDVWFRGIADLLIIDGDKASVIDYKTGKSSKYADKGQLELMAMCVFKHFPQVKKVKAGLLFVICKDLIKDTYVVESSPKLWEKWLGKYARMEKAAELNVWNPQPSGLCRRHCNVVECPHNGRNS